MFDCDSYLMWAREFVDIVATSPIGVYISVHWFITAQCDTLCETLCLDEGCQVAEVYVSMMNIAFGEKNMILCPRNFILIKMYEA
jgi:hypothetical protein